MNREELLHLFKQIEQGQLSSDDALYQVEKYGFEDLGFVKIDHHRAHRTGFPEVIYCQQKTPTQVLEIFSRLVDKNTRVLATRGTKEMYEAIKARIPSVTFNPTAGTISYRQYPYSITPNDKKGKVVVLAAGTSDLPVAEEALETLKIMDCPVEAIYDVGVAGIHRLFAHREKLTSASCLVVIAGMEGALPSVVGGLVESPVIACPTSVGYGANFQGVSPLLTMLNSCATGISVVNIDNGFGAGFQAALISRAIRKEV